MVPTIGIHGHWPVHEVEVDIRSLQQIQALLEAFLGTSVECAPELAGNEKVLTLHDASRDDILKGLTHFILILVAVRAVNVPVAALNGMDYGLLDLTRCRLPRSQAKGRNCGASVKRNCSIHFGFWVEDG